MSFAQQMRRKIFVSYHHKPDQQYYNRFSSAFDDKYEAVTDNSLERKVNSADVDYIMRCIRENNLSGSSCTVVLCGLETPSRKYVDWEIMASLNQQMGLVGVRLPSLQLQGNGGTFKPPRLQDNIDSGYAEWIDFTQALETPQTLTSAIERANAKSQSLIHNSRPRMKING